MNFCYWESLNFGDAVNQRFFRELTQQEIRFHPVGWKGRHFLATGSIMRLATDQSIIMGTGFISENDDLGRPDWSTSPTDTVYSHPAAIISVRGPKTRAKLLRMKVDCPEIYGDPLVLLPLVYPLQAAPSAHRILKVALIAHYADHGSKHLYEFSRSLGMRNIDVRVINVWTGPLYELLLDAVMQSDYVVSSSLHGVIVGIVYGKPTVWTQFSKDGVIGEGFKFQDFLQSCDIRNYRPPAWNDPLILGKTIPPPTRASLRSLGEQMLKTWPIFKEERRTELLDMWAQHIERLPSSTKEKASQVDDQV